MDTVLLFVFLVPVSASAVYGIAAQLPAPGDGLLHHVVAGILGLGILSVFWLVGLRSWLLRVRLTIHDGQLTATWHRWRGSPRSRTVPARDLRVETEQDDDPESGRGYRIVVVAGVHRLELTEDFRSTKPTDDVDRIRRFLEQHGPKSPEREAS